MPEIRRVTERAAALTRAHTLACEIEDLLTAVLQADSGYSVRLAQAMTRSLIDQLEEIERTPSSGTRLATHRSV